MSFFGSSVPTKKAVVKRVSVQVPTKQVTKPAARPSPNPQTKTSAQARPTSKVQKSNRLELPKAVAKHAPKRKASTPPPVWSDDEAEGAADDSDFSFDSARKRVRSSASSVDPSRTIGDQSNRLQEDKGIFPLAHGADLVSGEQAAEFLPAFVEEVATEIELQYPSTSQLER